MYVGTNMDHQNSYKEIKFELFMVTDLKLEGTVRVNVSLPFLFYFMMSYENGQERLASLKI